MPAPRDQSNKSPSPEQKLASNSPECGQIFGANPRGCAGEMVMATTDSRITEMSSNKASTPDVPE